MKPGSIANSRIERGRDPAPPARKSSRHLQNYGVRPDIIVERVSGLWLFQVARDLADAAIADGLDVME
jgi:hypothetical protein